MTFTDIARNLRGTVRDDWLDQIAAADRAMLYVEMAAQGLDLRDKPAIQREATSLLDELRGQL